MVKDYVIYRFEKVKVAEATLDDSVKTWQDDFLLARNLLPKHLEGVVLVTFRLLPEGRVIVASYPGNSSIRVLEDREGNHGR